MRGATELTQWVGGCWVGHACMHLGDCFSKHNSNHRHCASSASSLTEEIHRSQTKPEFRCRTSLSTSTQHLVSCQLGKKVAEVKALDLKAYWQTLNMPHEVVEFGQLAGPYAEHGSNPYKCFSNFFVQPAFEYSVPAELCNIQLEEMSM